MAQLFLDTAKEFKGSEIAQMISVASKNHNQEAKTLKTELPRVIEYLNKTAWAIIPESLDLINDIVWARLNGATDLAEIEARIGRPLNNEHAQVEVSEDGTAIIPVNGPIVKKASMFSRVSGMTSTEQLQSDIQAALDSPSVKKIHLDVDSPGGSVDGVKALSDFIFASRGKKPITAFTDGSMASAAYWIGSSADEIVASDTAIVGSIGVVAQHVDYSGRDAKDGRKRTYITAGKYKRIANDAEPLSAEGFDYLKRLIDSTYEVFVEDVARNRGVSKDKVLSDMADGKIFIGRDALKVGLVDRIGTINGDAFKEEDSNGIGVAGEILNQEIKKEEVNMDLAKLKAEFPGLVQAIADETKGPLVAETEGLKAKVTALTEENGKLSVENKDLSRQVAIQEEAATKVAAEGIQREVLSESGVPETLHAKVMKHVDFHAHIKDGKFDAEAFKVAFSADVKEWEVGLTGTSTQGSGVSDSRVDLSAKDKVDMELVNKVMGM